MAQADQPLPASTDVTNELAALRAALVSAQGEWQDLLYAVSHDLRAPLRHIQAYVQVIDEDFPGLPGELTGHLATIAQAAHKLTHQLDALTQLSRAAQAPLAMGWVDLAPLVHAARAALPADATSSVPTAPVRWELALDAPPVWADASLAQQVLVELLGNALKAVRNVPTPSIAVCMLAAGQLVIEDNGLGFDPAQADTLFKVFGKLHPASQFDGLGVGLVRARKLMARMQGAVALQPRPEGGCCATLRWTKAQN
jgi:light-regulated signal transduction histidine kinase (bacteriophytochrome)